MSMSNDNEPLSLGALLSNDPPQTSKEKHAMMKSIRGSTSSLKSIETSLSSKTYHPPSPTTSISESNIMATSDIEVNNNNNTIPANSLIQNLRFDAELDGEIQSPTNSLWDSLFSDQIDASADFMLISSPRREFMISSPKRDCMMSSPLRDYMISSPRRDYLISSPRRDYMISSPKREYMVASPKRTGMSSMSTASMYTQNFGYVHGAQGNNSNLKGKSQSPLHKVFNVSSSSNTAAQYDALLEEFGLYSNFKEEITPEVYDVAAIGGMTATLMECMSMPSMSLKYEDDNSSIGVGTQISNNSNALPEYGMMMNGNVNCYNSQSQSGGLMMGNASNNQNLDLDQDDNGLHLVHLLLACAESAAKDDYISAQRYLHHLNLIVSPLGDSMQRVASCFANALSSRLSPPPIVPPTANISSTLDTLKIYQILYQACPYIKFAHFTANQAIFEAFETEEHVHVIDLDILQGYQWPAFLQALAARPGGPPSLRITGVGYPAELIRETGRHLAELAHSLGVPFEFHVAVADRLEELRPHMLHRRVGEALAVNSVNRLHRVPGPQLGNLLSMIRDQAPNIVTLVEQEAAHNSPHFLPRFLEALHYYSAVFDSLDATFPSDSTARAKVEQCIFLPEIRNIVACEGPYRVERHERLEKWRKIMEGKGFKEVALSQNAVTQSNILLGLYSCEGYRLNQDQGCLLLGWQDRAIIAASAWRC